MRAVQLEHAHPTATVSEHHQVLAHDADPQRHGAEIARERDGLPEAPQVLAGRRPRPHAHELVLGRRHFPREVGTVWRVQERTRRAHGTGYTTPSWCDLSRYTRAMSDNIRESTPGTDALDELRRPGEYIDSDAENIVALARRVAGDAPDDLTRAIRLYYGVRDEIVYTPYCDFRSVDTFRASATLARGSGFCVAKAAVLAAAARASGIAARVGFADVRNHLTTTRLRERMGTDTFYYHGYTELHLDGRWVKATPAFDAGLCQRFGVRALEFDGRHDSLFHPYDAAGRRHMEYIRERGAAADVPVAAIMETFARYYPGLVAAPAPAAPTQFRQEAEPVQESST